METFKKILSWLRSLPVWARVVAIVIAVLVSAVLLFTGCSTIRTTMNSAGEIHTNVNQSVLDSTHISIHLFSKPSNN